MVDFSEPDLDRVPRVAKTLAWILFLLNELRGQGLIAGPFPEFTPDGRNMAKTLLKSGFMPTKEEITDVFNGFDQAGLIEADADCQAVIETLIEFAAKYS